VKIFRREQSSLFSEILDWMLTPILLLWPISLLLTWLVAQGLADKPFDRALESNAVALSRLITVEDQKPRFQLNPNGSPLPAGVASDTAYYQVLGPDGALLGGDALLPQPEDIGEEYGSGRPFLREVQINGKAHKVAALWVQLPVSPGHPALVQVAQTLDQRAVLATEIVKGVMLPQFAILPLAVLLVWLALVQAIKPLHRLEERIRARDPQDLSPLDVQAVPVELMPLVSSVNDLLLRLTDSIATQKRFLAEAAHQLKTPLAGLRMQADLAQREGASAEDLKLSLRQVGRSSVRATHTVNQLLSLARAESSGVVLQHEPCDLAQIAVDVMHDCAPRALVKFLDMGYEGPEPGSPGTVIRGNPTLLREMLLNLVDNAINYTPSSQTASGVITTRLLVDPFSRAVVLQVEDSGPGIAQAERELVFRPFYRALGTGMDGSGLGLPIVLEIARQHAASVSVDASRPGHNPPGACFTVRFMRAQAA
jgi:two-component system sensor histidine kinase TctE